MRETKWHLVATKKQKEKIGIHDWSKPFELSKASKRKRFYNLTPNLPKDKL